MLGDEAAVAHAPFHQPLGLQLFPVLVGVLGHQRRQVRGRRVEGAVGEAGGAVYIDMGDTAGRVIEISGGRWRITDTAPVLFRRTKLTGQLPDPQTGNLAALWEFMWVRGD